MNIFFSSLLAIVVSISHFSSTSNFSVEQPMAEVALFLENKTVFVLQKEGAMLYSKPQLSAPTGRTFDYATPVKVVERRGDWVHVEYESNEYGWLCKADLGFAQDVKVLPEHLYKEASFAETEEECLQQEKNYERLLSLS